ncbi:hypothetical protein PVAP13_3KG237200 [Panicum virgatum]|uniref:Uncharacterized protein n=1 Tax=Panicum virgatum TaxID=38727 RepID=A0A8T0V5B2_PANVG|nr:hypothetical protein PVAP13_3KG237200 [Panicum virgatum]
MPAPATSTAPPHRLPPPPPPPPSHWARPELNPRPCWTGAPRDSAAEHRSGAGTRHDGLRRLGSGHRQQPIGYAGAPTFRPPAVATSRRRTHSQCGSAMASSPWTTPVSDQPHRS